MDTTFRRNCMEYAFRPVSTRILVLGALIAISASSAIAQISKGSISGTVVDPSGAAVAGAEVRATSQQTAQIITTTTDSMGLFRLNLVPVGTYTVEIIPKAGFRKIAVSNVAVSSNVDNVLGAI